MKNKKIVIITLAIIIILSLGIYLAISSNKDSVKFKNDYEAYNNLTYKENNKQNKYENLDINKNNPIIYLTDETILKIETGKNMSKKKKKNNENHKVRRILWFNDYYNTFFCSFTCE